MAKFEALRSFGGPVSGVKGKELTLTDKEVIDDLLQAGYIKAVGGNAPAKKPAEKKPAAKPAEKPAEETPAPETPAPAPVAETTPEAPAANAAAVKK